MNITPETLLHLLGAQDFYTAHGYKNVAVPWIVSAKADEATRPISSAPYELSTNRRLIGSGEQGFIQLMLDGQLAEDGRFQTITPCFRDEYNKSDITLEYFLKLELWCGINKQQSAEYIVESVARTALALHEILGIRAFLEPTEIGLDLKTYDGLELGSYGIRTIDGHYPYVYGTGLAQPRANIAVQTSQHSLKREQNV